MFDTRNLSKEERDKFLADRTLAGMQTSKEDLDKYWQVMCRQTQNINYKRSDESGEPKPETGTC